MSDQFIHLHVHSEFSLLDSPNRIKTLIDYAKTHQLSHMALTDNGVMFGAIDFYLEAKQAGITPIIGCELYMVENLSEKTKPVMRMIALCKNTTGYHHLAQLVSESHTKHFYYKPRVDLDLLKQFSEGLIFIAPGHSGPIADALKMQQLDLAKQRCHAYKQAFGNNFYIGLQQTEPNAQARCQQLAQLAKDFDIQPVVTQDVYYEKPEDVVLKEILHGIQFGRVLEDDDLIGLKQGQHDLKTPAQMQELFCEYPEALANTLHIAQQCHVSFELDRVNLPEFACPNNLSAEDYLTQLVWEGIDQRYAQQDEALKKRVEFELDIIKSMHFSKYFLIIYDFLDYCYKEHIPVGPGRGSAAGSIVAYALGITAIDPLPYNLLFERFLNPERVSMPDIDLDFCIKRREEVIQFITQRYGQDHVAQIITFGTMQARAVVRDVGRVLNVPLTEVDRLAKLIPAAPGHYTSIKEALETVPELKDAYDTMPSTKQLLNYGMQLEGVSRHSSTHAAGVVISKDPLAQVVPLAQNDGQQSTQYSMNILEKLGLLKMDILGLRNLTVIDLSLKLIKSRHQIELDLNNLEMTDTATYTHLCEGHTLGIFQLESAGMRKLIKELKPSCFEDLIALLALYRPGPLGSGMVQDFISNKAGTTSVSYQLECLEPILKDTYGLILYQEQVMQIASAVGGFSLAQADMLRRAMGKKKKSVMDEMKVDFLEGAKAKSFDVDIASAIFELCYKFSEYGFNKSHSAAYAMISYQTAYLKTHYPTEYLAALMSSVMGSSDKIAEYIQEARRMGIQVLPPSVLHSQANFICDDTSIRFGLAAIKNVGEGAIESIVQQRSGPHAYESMEDFFLKVDLRQVNKRVLENLIYAGAFDELDADRSALLGNYERRLEQAQAEAKHRASGQSGLFDAMGVSPFQDTDHVSEAMPEVDALTLCYFEKEALGLFFSKHPLDFLSKSLLEKHAKINSLGEDDNNKIKSFVGLLTQVRQSRTKTNKAMVMGQLEDKVSCLEWVAFCDSDEDPLLNQLQSHVMVILTGRVRYQNDRIGFMVQAVNVIDTTTEQEHVHIDVETLNHQEIDDIRKTCLESKHVLPVYLHLQQHVVLAHQRYFLCKETLKHLQAEYGQQRIWSGVAKKEEAVLAGE